MPWAGYTPTSAREPAHSQRPEIARRRSSRRPYATAKTAIVGYIHGLALQLADKNIRANTVAPGNTYFEGGFWQNIETGNPSLFEIAVKLNPTGHMGTPEEVAPGQPAARRVSRTNLVVDGALTRGVQL
jgi:NAD(P)-dependent dehydrogenase (short-subunit alcohol dehydrogenase family)